MSIPAGFTWEKPAEQLEFKDKELVKFQIKSIAEYRHEDSGAFGIELSCEVLDAPLSSQHQGQLAKMTFPFVTKKGTQNPMTYYFLSALFPESQDGNFPYMMLEGMSFQAASKRTPSPDGQRLYQNWQGYKLLDNGSDSNQY